MKTKVTCYY